jgi:hypothetical protein
MGFAVATVFPTPRPIWTSNDFELRVDDLRPGRFDVVAHQGGITRGSASL